VVFFNIGPRVRRGFNPRAAGADQPQQPASPGPDHRKGFIGIKLVSSSWAIEQSNLERFPLSGVFNLI